MARRRYPSEFRRRVIDLVEGGRKVAEVAVAVEFEVSSNEPVNEKRDGNTAPDWGITGDLSVSLRAERTGRGSGRIYTITVDCTDASGNTATETVVVIVPHDQKKGRKQKKGKK
jgi:hypothetical protein